MVMAPPPSVSLRQSPKGGEVLTTFQPNPTNVLRLSRRLLLLIHGYNNDLEAGKDAYQGFIRVQHELADLPPDRPICDGQIVGVYWPGDADWGIFSALYYPWSIEKAKTAAASLATALESAAREGLLHEVDVIAHSMGSRLTLELLKQLLPTPRIRVARIVFMAAAVPVFMLDPADGQKLRAAYETMLAGGAISLYSRDDMVLNLAFPVGQTAAGAGEGWFPTALGHDIWLSHLTPPNLLQYPVNGAGHSDYWGWKEETLDRAREANKHIREFLRFTSGVVRETPSRVVVERDGPEERTTTEYRSP